MKRALLAFTGWFSRNLGAKFGIGLITIVPIGGTIWILWWGFDSIDNILQPFIRQIWGHDIQGLGFGVTVAFILLVGFLASNVVGRAIIHQVEKSALPWLPIFRQLYWGIKQILEGFAAPTSSRSMPPVLVEFPRKGMRTLGFITNEFPSEDEKKLFTVFIPTSPNPTSGFLVIVEEDELIRTGLSMENALKMVVSAGKVLPQEVIDKIPKAS